MEAKSFAASVLRGGSGEHEEDEDRSAVEPDLAEREEGMTTEEKKG